MRTKSITHYFQVNRSTEVTDHIKWLPSAISAHTLHLCIQSQKNGCLFSFTLYKMAAFVHSMTQNVCPCVSQNIKCLSSMFLDNVANFSIHNINSTSFLIRAK
uniref:Uncharacterized protein n=1 Tax=Pyxicephalus adspersus TaxID=30357 RepID=A0AAV2ZTV4_PYXAD|nr:TPA: hypothetical protein GDO54_016187 [Pyxicephalus adspersus]